MRERLHSGYFYLIYTFLQEIVIKARATATKSKKIEKNKKIFQKSIDKRARM